MVGVEGFVEARGACCNTVGADTRCAQIILSRAGEQVNQPRLLLYATSPTLKRLGIPHQVETGESFTADRNWGGVYIVIGR